MSENGSDLQHAVWVATASSRDVKGTKKYRSRKRRAPAKGSPFSAFVAELEETVPAQAMKAADAFFKGFTLLQDGMWNDVGTMSKAKAMDYLLDNIGDEKWSTMLADNGKDATIAHIRAHVGNGGDRSANDIDETEAKTQAKLLKTHHDDYMDSYLKSLER